MVTFCLVGHRSVCLSKLTKHKRSCIHHQHRSVEAEFPQIAVLHTNARMQLMGEHHHNKHNCTSARNARKGHEYQMRPRSPARLPAVTTRWRAVNCSGHNGASGCITAYGGVRSALIKASVTIAHTNTKPSATRR